MRGGKRFVCKRGEKDIGVDSLQVRPTGSLVMLSSQAFNVTVAAASLSEWMSNKVSQQFQAAADFALLPTVGEEMSTRELV